MRSFYIPAGTYCVWEQNGVVLHRYQVESTWFYEADAYNVRFVGAFEDAPTPLVEQLIMDKVS